MRGLNDTSLTGLIPANLHIDTVQRLQILRVRKKLKDFCMTMIIVKSGYDWEQGKTREQDISIHNVAIRTCGRMRTQSALSTRPSSCQKRYVQATAVVSLWASCRYCSVNYIHRAY